MVKLAAKSPCAGLLPITIGSLSLQELPQAGITSVAPYRGQDKALSKALKSAIGAGLPKPGASTSKGDTQVIWAGRDQFLVLGASLPDLPCAMTDQSDAWAVVGLDGPGAGDVMARLCPLDCGALSPGDVARSLIGHMQAVILRRDSGYQLMVFRAFAGTLVHEVEIAMRAATARAALPKT